MAAAVLFLGKQGDPYSQRAQEFLALNFPETTVLLGQRGQPFPERYTHWRGDYIISYLCPWILPEHLLERAKVASVNFHPGPPEYPGIGCTNFAIYNQEVIFGVTCHHMATRVDTGKIVAVRRFPLFQTDTVLSLTERCYSYMLTLFYEVVSEIIQRRPLPSCDEAWKRRPYKRAELNALCRITPDMSPEEVRRRVRATTFPGMPGAYVDIEGIRFTLAEDGE